MDAILRGPSPWWRAGSALAVLLLIIAVAPPAAAASPTVTAISAGRFHGCARTSDGAAWCWGDNEHGQLGDGTTTDRPRAVRVTKLGGGPLSQVTSVSTGYGHSCTRTSDGAAWCWGDNEYGQLGDGTETDRLGAVRVTKQGGGPLAGVTAVSAGGLHSCALRSDGTVWCWGLNEFGQLGIGQVGDRPRAVRVTRSGGTPLVGVTTISAGFEHSCARTSDGAAWCWGWNPYGQLGQGATSLSRARAVRVVKKAGEYLTGVTSISAGRYHSCARTNGGSAWCWGRNEYGQLGDGTTRDRPWAVRVTRSGGTDLVGTTSVSAGHSHSCGRTNDGAAWCWGWNNWGQLGDGTTADRLRAVRATQVGGANLGGVTSITTADHSCARTSDGTAWCWGENEEGQLGDGTTTWRARAVRVKAAWAQTA